jgi:hypothetical protein
MNLEDRRLNPNSTLRFEKESRGVFLAVDWKGETYVFPSFSHNLQKRDSLEGVFIYRPAAGSLQLAEAARAQRSGDGWVLVQAGIVEG